MRKAALAFVAASLLAGQGRALTPAQKFNTPWQMAPDVVMGTIGSHDVPECDRIYARRSVSSPAGDPDNSDFLVYCTNDDKKFTAWEVIPNEDDVKGPLPLLPGVPLPDPRKIPQQ